MKIHNWPTSLPSSLTRWQIGLPFHRHEMDESPRFTANVLRQLIKSRSDAGHDADSQIESVLEFDLQKAKRKEKTYEPTTVNSFGWILVPSIPQFKFELLNQYIIIQGPDLFHFYIPSHSLQSPFPKLHFSLPSWRSYDVWHIKPTSPIMSHDGRLLKIPNTLILLEMNGRALLLYDLETGKKIQELKLEEEYDQVVVQEEEDLIYVKSATRQYLTFKYPPLQLVYKVNFPLNSWNWSGLEEFQRSNSIALASKKNSVELFDYEELISSNRGNSRTEITLNQKPLPLMTLRTKGGHLVFLPGSYPPKVIVHRGKGMEEIYNLEDDKHPIFQVVSRVYDKGMISYFDERRQIIFVFQELKGFEVLGFNEAEGNYTNIFNSKDLLEKYHYVKKRRHADDGTSGSSRCGLRTRKQKINYDEIEGSVKQWCVGCDNNLDLVAICLFCDSLLYTFILDGGTPNMDLFLKLSPFKITVPDIPERYLGCSSLCVHFNEWFISVKMKFYNIKTFVKLEHVYTINLVGEKIGD